MNIIIIQRIMTPVKIKTVIKILIEDYFEFNSDNFFRIETDIGSYRFYKNENNHNCISNVTTGEIIMLEYGTYFNERTPQYHVFDDNDAMQCYLNNNMTKTNIRTSKLLYQIIDNLSMSNIKFIISIMMVSKQYYITHNDDGHDEIKHGCFINQLKNVYNICFKSSKYIDENNDADILIRRKRKIDKPK